jgi:GntR family transcriptional regulator
LLNINISEKNGKPIYRQVFEQISENILLGKIGSEDMLPSIRTLSNDLKISIITIKRAYEELERYGLIYTVPGKGCFVSKINKEKAYKILINDITDELEKVIKQAKKVNISKKDLINILEQRY